MVDGVAAQRLRARDRLLVDRPIGLAGKDHVAARMGVEIRDRARAIDQMVTALDHDIRIGADHCELARAHRVDQLDVVLRRLAGVVVEARAHREVGALDRRELDIEPLEDRQVALGSNMEHAHAGALSDQRASHVPRADDRIIGLARHLEGVDEGLHEVARPRRIGDQHHGAALAAEPHQRCAGFHGRGDAVVHHAPDVAEHHVVAWSERREMGRQGRRGGRHGNGSGHGMRQTSASAAGCERSTGSCARP